MIFFKKGEHYPIRYAATTFTTSSCGITIDNLYGPFWWRSRVVHYGGVLLVLRYLAYQPGRVKGR